MRKSAHCLLEWHFLHFRFSKLRRCVLLLLRTGTLRSLNSHAELCVTPCNKKKNLHFTGRTTPSSISSFLSIISFSFSSLYIYFPSLFLSLFIFYLYYFYLSSRNSSAGIATRPERKRTRGSIPGRSKWFFFLFQKVQTHYGALPASSYSTRSGSSPSSQMATPPSSGKVNISTPHMLLRRGAKLSRGKTSLPSYHLFFFFIRPHILSTSRG